MSANVAVGFSPVAPGNGVVNIGAAASAEAESPLGFLGALIETLVQGVVPAAEGEAAPDVSLGGLADIGLAVSSEINVAAPQPALPETIPAATGEDLLSQLVNALAALDQAVADGKPVDPALKKKLTETLDALAGLLGIQLPAPPAVDPAITAAASATGEIPADPDPLLEIAKAAAPSADVPAPAQPVVPAPAPAGSTGGSDFDALIAASANIIAAGDAQATAKAEGDAAETPVVATTAPVAEGKPPVDPNSPIGKIVQKLAELAEALTTQSPELAKKLEVIAQKLTAGEINAEALAKLGAATDLDAETVEALLAPKPESKPAPAPQLFAAPNLTLPETVVPAPRQTTTPPTAPVEETPAPAKPDEEESETGTVKLAVDPKPSDKREIGDGQNSKPNSFAAALSESRAGQPETNSQQPAQPAQVRTELGIVVPKAAHAAYQAPVQQVNLPQVAFEVARQFQQGHSRFQIRLDPPELGRIDVHMKVDRDGNVNARMTVERVETLDLMQRDQRSLEKALAQAGLDSSKTSLEFSLRQNPFAREESGNGRGGQGSPFAGGRDNTTGDEAPEITATTQYRGSASASGVNLFV